MGRRHHPQTDDRSLIKVNCNREQRDEVLKICEVYRARAIDMSPDRITIEITGARDKVEGLVSVLKPFGILELVQTGTVAMTRGMEKHDRAHPTVPASRNDAA